MIKLIRGRKQNLTCKFWKINLDNVQIKLKSIIVIGRDLLKLITKITIM